MSESNIPNEFYRVYPEPVVKGNLMRIGQEIEKIWGTEQGMQYLETLLVVEDDRTREGFAPEILSELLLLGRLHEKAYPEFEVTKLGDSFKFGT